MDMVERGMSHSASRWSVSKLYPNGDFNTLSPLSLTSAKT